MLFDCNESVIQHITVDMVKITLKVDLREFKDVYLVYKCVVRAKYAPKTQGVSRGTTFG